MAQSPNEPSDKRTLKNLSGDQTRTFFELGIRGPHPMIHYLEERLSQPDGTTWLGATFDQLLVNDSGAGSDDLATGGIGINDLESMKQCSKRLHQDSHDVDTRARAFVGYFLTLAAARLHHSAHISGRSPEEVATILLDLADTLPEPWCHLASRAAMSEGSS